MKRKLAGIGLILVLFMSTVSFVSAESAGFTTERFDVDVTISEDHVMSVTETIDVDFYESRHGIFRYIPYDGKAYTIDNQAVYSDSYEEYREDSNVVFQIGDPYETIRGEHRYQLGYDLVCYEDDDSTVDYLSLDVIPPEWQTAIKSAEIYIEFPKAVDPEAIKIFSGIYGFEGNEVEVEPVFSKDGKTMTIKATDLEQGQAITIAAELPEGYWEGEASRDWMMGPLVGILILVPLLLGVLWFIFGRDPKIVKTVEFYAPEGMTPAEVGYVVDGTVNNKDLSAMIVYFAEKGYLDIHEYDDDKFELVKKTPIDSGEKRYAKTLFNAYFSHGDRVKMEELPEDLGDFYDVAKMQVKSCYRGEDELYRPVSRVCRILGGVLYLILAIIPAFLATMVNYNIDWRLALAPIALTGAAGMMLLIMTFDGWNSMSRRSRIGMLFLGWMLLLINGFINGAMIVILLEKIWVALLAGIALTVSVVFITLMQARTRRTTDLLGKLLGFRDFIKTAELDRLKLMAEENPSYFYDIMPYAYVFGLSDVWMKKFKDIAVSKPGWYSGRRPVDAWDVYWYSRMMNRCMTRMDHSVASSIAANSMDKGGGGIGGGFGGGGFSGGGFGGGGGGSW